MLVGASLQFRGAGWASRFIYPPQFPSAGRLSVILLPILRIHCGVWVAVSRQFPAAGWNTTLIQFLSPRAIRITRILRRIIFFALTRFLDTTFMVSVSPLPNLLLKHFHELSWTWHSAFCLKENGCRKTSRNSWYSTNEGDGTTHHVWSFLCSACLRVGFWCQHIWFWSWAPNWFCRTTNQAHQGSGHVSHRRTSALHDHCLITASLPSKMYNWDSPWEEFSFVVLSTCDNWSTSRFPFCLGLDVWFREQLPAAKLVGVLVLFDVIHPFAVQHPTKWFQIL